MKILRIFINRELDLPANWKLIDGDNEVEQGQSLLQELIAFEEVSLEVYLDSSCCSIFKITIAGISNRKLTDELVLGMIEDKLVDDIEYLKPVLMRIEDDMAYVAVFNNQFYTELVDVLHEMGKPVIFVQSFVYVTKYEEDAWTLYVDENQAFLRTGKFQYFLLDDDRPIPLLLENMLAANAEVKHLLVYGLDTDSVKHLEQKYKINCQIHSELGFGVSHWNFYNRKSSQFAIKLDPVAKAQLKRFLQIGSYFLGFLAIIWLLNVVTYAIDSYKINKDIQRQLNTIKPNGGVQLNDIAKVNREIRDAKHARGLYSNSDAFPLFNLFLNVVPEVEGNQILQIDYDGSQLKVFLGEQFNSGQFTSYSNIFRSSGVSATLISYKDFAKNQQKTTSDQVVGNQVQIGDKAKWVLILIPETSTLSLGGN